MILLWLTKMMFCSSTASFHQQRNEGNTHWTCLVAKQNATRTSLSCFFRHFVTAMKSVRPRKKLFVMYYNNVQLLSECSIVESRMLSKWNAVGQWSIYPVNCILRKCWLARSQATSIGGVTRIENSEKWKGSVCRVTQTQRKLYW